MKIEITNKVENPLFDRTEVSFEVIQDGPTPSRAEVVKELASLMKADVDMVVIHVLHQPFGMKKTFGKARIYKTKDAMAIEPEYLLERTKKSLEKAQPKEDNNENQEG